MKNEGNGQIPESMGTRQVNMDPGIHQIHDINEMAPWHVNEKFIFSCKKNAQGGYITEIQGDFCNIVLIEVSEWEDFKEVLDDYKRQCKDQIKSLGTRQANVDYDVDPIHDINEMAPWQVNGKFIFSCKTNAQGRYVTEIQGDFCNTVLIGDSEWEDFKEVLDDYMRQCEEQD